MEDQRDETRLEPVDPKSRKRWFIALPAVAVLAAAGVIVGLTWDNEPKAGVGAEVDLAKPYTGTPAANWAEGLAGITSPAARPVGGFTAAEVDAAFKQARAAISAVRLDPRALNDHDGSVLLNLLSPRARTEFEPMLTGRDTTEKSKLLILLGEHRLLPVSPRMSGTLTAKPGPAKGELVIHAAYVTAYAFDGPKTELTSPADFVSLVRDEQDYLIRAGARFAKADVGLSYGEGSGYTSYMACDAAKVGILAPQVL